MTDSVRKQMWEALSASPFVMLHLSNSHDHAIPMAAQLDPDAEGEFWFCTTRDNRVAQGGPAMAQFTSLGHDLFCCISGTLVEETDKAVIDRYWSNAVAAWYDQGRNDPNLLMMRFELDDAEIWTRDSSFKGLFKLMSGQKVNEGELGQHKVVDLESAS